MEEKGRGSLAKVRHPLHNCAAWGFNRYAQARAANRADSHGGAGRFWLATEENPGQHSPQPGVSTWLLSNVMTHMGATLLDSFKQNVILPWDWQCEDVGGRSACCAVALTALTHFNSSVFDEFDCGST